MPNQGMTLLSTVAALAVAATLSLSWFALWQQQQALQQVQVWRLSMLQLQQAQRNFYRLQGRFADSQSQLVSAALLPQPLVFPDTGRWQFEADQHRLIMRAEIHRPSVTLLMKDFNDYHWQPPMLSVKVIGYAAP